VVDRFIDVPPYPWEASPRNGWAAGQVHLKLALDDFPSTCFGLVVEKGGGSGSPV
jgi:hypothetical protein